MLDSVDDSITRYFKQIERYDVSAGFDQAQPGHAIARIGAWPGVWRAEPTLDIPVELERGGATHSTVLTGLSADSRLRHLTTASGRRVVPQPGEVLLGALLREKFGVQEGDRLTLHYAQNSREFKISRTARVGPAISQPIGSSVYMRSDDVQRLFADRLGLPPRAATGVLIRCEPARVEWVRRRLYREPAVAAVETRAQIHQQIEELMRFTEAFTAIMAIFGVGLSFAVVFTTVSITVLERARELATLRTLGFGLGRIAWLTTLENMLIAAAGAALGLPLGRWLDVYLISTFQSESMALEPVIYLRTYVIAVVGVAFLTLISQIPSLLHVRRMNLAAATKEVAG
jgi:putative ABC transport system permease protein